MRQFSSNTILRMTIALFVVLIFALLFFYRDDIFQSMLDPGEPFQTYEAPTAPDYNEASAWMVLPDLEADPYNDPTFGDVFVVAPGLYKGGEHWNLPVDNARRREKLQHVIVPNYVMPFAKAGRVFAPYYRQASLYTFMTSREDARLAQDLAYQDVRKAFRFFLKNSPPERPIILVGQDQGGSHVQRLLADFFSGDLKNRLAAAYVIGHPLPLDKFENELANLSPCENEADINCVVAFGAFMPSDGLIARRFVNRLKVYESDDYEVVANRPLLCMNPLLWDRSSDYAPRRLHLGGVAANGLETDMEPAPISKQTGAQCQDGILYIDRPRRKVFRRPIKFGGKFRTLPFNIFYEDLKVNAQVRVNALLETGKLPRRTNKLDDLEIIEIIESPVTPIVEGETPGNR